MDRKINIHTKDKNTKYKQKGEYGTPSNLSGPQETKAGRHGT